MLVSSLAKRAVTGKLWIAQPDRVRECQEESGKEE
jgi:hypothetical protein